MPRVKAGLPIMTIAAPVKPSRLLQRASMLILPVAACAGMALLWASATQRSMWIDEWFTYTSSRQSTLSGVLAQVMSTERQPPLDWVLVHLWMGLGGVNELWVRTFSILWVLISAALLYLITVRLRSPATARLAAALLLLSPLVIMYGPMIRYYSFAMATVLACTLAYLHYLQSP